MSYKEAQKKYAKIGIDTEKAIKDLGKIAISLHCWQGDDVGGFETTGGASGGIATTGNYPGKARTPEELMKDCAAGSGLPPAIQRICCSSMVCGSTSASITRDPLQGISG